FNELVARVHALTRRAHRPLPPVLRRRGVELDTARGRAARDGRPLALTVKELAVLRLLLAADGAIVSAEQLLEPAWDEHAPPLPLHAPGGVGSPPPRPPARRPAADRHRHRRRLRHPVRFSIRTRLALLYGGVFFTMGIVLMAISFAIVDHSLSPAVATGTVV